jgi:hypothetical protein
MKVTVERATLLKTLGHVHRVVERRNTIPILANVLIKGDNSIAIPIPRMGMYSTKYQGKCNRLSSMNYSWWLENGGGVRSGLDQPQERFPVKAAICVVFM